MSTTNITTIKPLSSCSDFLKIIYILLTSSKNQIYEFRIPNIYNTTIFLITFDLCIHFVFLSPLSNSKCIKKLSNFHLNNKKYSGVGIRKFGFSMTWARYKCWCLIFKLYKTSSKLYNGWQFFNTNTSTVRLPTNTDYAKNSSWKWGEFLIL